MKYTLTQNQGLITDEDIVNLIHESFSEHFAKGMNFTCSRYTIEDVRNKFSKSKVLYAISDSGKLLGITAFSHYKGGGTTKT